MAESEVEALHKKLQSQEQRLRDLQQFRDLGKIPLPLADLYQFPQPDSKLSEAQLFEVTRLLQNRLEKEVRANKRLRGALHEELLAKAHQHAEVTSYERAFRDKAASCGFGGSAEGFVALQGRVKAGKSLGREVARVKNDLLRAEIVEKELESRLCAMQSIATGAETAAQYLSNNISDAKKATQELTVLRSELSEIQTYLHQTESLPSDFVILEKRQLDLQENYQRLQHARFRLDSHFRILTRDLTDFQPIRDQLSSLQAENSLLKSSLHSTHAKVQTAEAESVTLATALFEAEEQRHALCSTPTFISDERVTLESATEAVSARLHSLQQDLLRLKSDGERLKQRLWQVEKENSELRLRRGRMEEQQRRVMDDLTNIVKDRESISKGKGMHEVTSALELDQRKCELDSLLRKAETLKSDLSESTLLLFSLKADHAMATSACQSLPFALQSEAHLRTQLLETQACISQSRLETAALFKSLSTLRLHSPHTNVGLPLT